MQENLSFEQAFARLGETVQSLEKGGLSLEEATRLFEEGMRLAQLCNQLLSQAELKITRLAEAYATYLEEQPPTEEEK